MIKQLVVVFMLAIALAACSRSYLSVQTEYLRREKLASFHVGTPDPLLNYPLMGQRLTVEWSIPESYLLYEDLHIMLRIRFIDQTELQRKIPIAQSSGTYIYTIEGADFCEREGIFTYKADLIGNGEGLSCWQHQLWTELIQVGSEY